MSDNELDRLSEDTVDLDGHNLFDLATVLEAANG